ncbi:hypothetical protein OOT00_06085 [Desulfobotulus sp. H1]|uniref:Uncharacterized protein n=1 Tax=Desulfobotulus pelophilus TaxID=2823377 RepID=A0ABT3N966_9BACT|nr:hypothetical protein [Desulfobotulus pelophilus]MCW7753557.1 hypothetical protein [Desulfobotulus pelophilus]
MASLSDKWQNDEKAFSLFVRTAYSKTKHRCARALLFSTAKASAGATNHISLNNRHLPTPPFRAGQDSPAIRFRGKRTTYACLAQE